jgi:hypothetical protein
MNDSTSGDNRVATYPIAGLQNKLNKINDNEVSKLLYENFISNR